MVNGSIQDKTKIRILFMIDFFYGLKEGGTENQFIKLIQHLDQSRYEPLLLTLRKTQWIADNEKRLNCSVTSYDLWKIKNPMNIITVMRIIRYMKAVKPHIVITFFPLSNIIGVIAAKLAGVPRIISTRRDYGLWFNAIFRGDGFFLKFANKFVDGIIANAYCVQELASLKEHFDKEKIKVIYNGINMENFERNGQHNDNNIKVSFGIPQDSKVVGIVANLLPMKRHLTLLNAAKHVLSRRRDIHFLLVGGGPLKNDLELYAHELGIEKNVHFGGSHDNVLPFLGVVDIGVNCSANEGLSNAVMEYMASGIPCIVSNAGGNPELVQDGVNGYVFELGNAEHLAARILGLLEDPEKQKEFAKKSREIIATRFTLERMIADYDNYFTRSLSNGHITEEERER